MENPKSLKVKSKSKSKIEQKNIRIQYRVIHLVYEGHLEPKSSIIRFCKMKHGVYRMCLKHHIARGLHTHVCIIIRDDPTDKKITISYKFKHFDLFSDHKLKLTEKSKMRLYTPLFKLCILSRYFINGHEEEVKNTIENSEGYFNYKYDLNLHFDTCKKLLLLQEKANEKKLVKKNFNAIILDQLIEGMKLKTIYLGLNTPLKMQLSNNREKIERAYNDYREFTQKEYKIILRPFQISILTIIKKYYDLCLTKCILIKNILCFIDITGQIGKTSFGKEFCRRDESVLHLTNGTTKNLSLTYIPWKHKIILFNMPRDTDPRMINYQIIELLSDGNIFSGKYNSKMKSIIFAPLIVILSNKHLIYNKLTLSRWQIYESDHKTRTFVSVSYPKTNPNGLISDVSSENNFDI